MSLILEQINSAGQAFVEFAIPMLVQSSLLILILLFVDLLLRKKMRAGFRYWIWILVLIKLALPTSLSTPVSLGRWLGDELAVMDVGEMTSARDAVEIDAARHARLAIPIRPDSETPLPASKPVSLPVVSMSQIKWQGVVFLVWLAVVIAMVVLLLHRTLFVRRLVAQAKKANDSMSYTLAQCCKSMGIRSKVGLRISTNAMSPAVCRLLRPVILLSQNIISRLDKGQLRIVLMHELAHLKRFDLWINFGQTFLQIVYFYNPLLWLANAIIRRTREQAVDEAVLVAMGEEAQEYLDTLVNVAKLAFIGPTLSLRLIGVVESKSLFEWRIRTMLSRPIPKSSKLGILGTIVVVVVAAVLLPMAKAQKPEAANEPAISENERRPTNSLQRTADSVAFAQPRLAPTETTGKQDDKPAKSLVEAVIEGDTEQVRLRIAEGADVNAQVYMLQPLLHHAIARGDKSMVQLLLSKGANIEAKGRRDRETPLHIASRNDLAGIASLLLTAGADINARNNMGRTPLHLAVAAGAKDVTDLLISKGAEIDAKAKNDMGRTPLHYTAVWGHPEIAELLVAKSADINAKDNDGRTPLYLAMHASSRLRGDLKTVVQLLAAKGTGVSAAHLAAYLGDLAKVKDSIQAGVNVNSQDEAGYTLLHAAAAGGDTEMVDFLLVSGADVSATDKNGATPLHVAAGRGNTKVVQLLVSKGANVNMKDDRGQTPLHESATYDRKEVAEVLIANGADIEMADIGGMRPLHAAAWNSAPGASTSTAVAELLIAKGADINAEDSGFGTPLIASVVIRGKHITELLIAKGADVNMGGAGDYAPFTPLYWAVINGYPEIATLLVEKGADVNVRVYDNTPLHAAIEYALRETAELLISNGADVNAKDEKGRTPLSIAKERGYTGMMELLRKHGARE
jgi:ankyrin repeat protein/beta-lactamase regulating signal transducer with metallopeptidase domain